jgi:hypothetical protein
MHNLNDNKNVANLISGDISQIWAKIRFYEKTYLFDTDHLIRTRFNN